MLVEQDLWDDIVRIHNRRAMWKGRLLPDSLLVELRYLGRDDPANIAPKTLITGAKESILVAVAEVLEAHIFRHCNQVLLPEGVTEKRLLLEGANMLCMWLASPRSPVANLKEVQQVRDWRRLSTLSFLSYFVAFGANSVVLFRPSKLLGAKPAAGYGPLASSMHRYAVPVDVSCISWSLECRSQYVFGQSCILSRVAFFWLWYLHAPACPCRSSFWNS
jgi:hypothetical protein